MQHSLIITSDGSHTIYVPELDEHYHSVHGAIQESQHIFINNGLKYLTGRHINIFEVGFGTGLNALLTAIESRETGKIINYTSIEKFPLDLYMVENLNYSSLAGGEDIFSRLHSAPWNLRTTLFGNFTLEKIQGDILQYSPEGNYDLIYFDAFGPDKQPEMWDIGIFSKIAEVTQRGGVLVTYSAKGQVKRDLRSCGFEVQLLPGPPGKRQVIRAVKK